jgi:hypothetical protein
MNYLEHEVYSGSYTHPGAEYTITAVVGIFNNDTQSWSYYSKILRFTVVE